MSQSTTALPTVWLSFDLVGPSFDPDAVSTKLGLKPTSQHRAGDPIRAGLGKRRHARWRVTIGPELTYDIDGMLSALLARLEPAKARIREVCDTFHLEARIICAVEPSSSQAPAIFFPPAVIGWAAEIGCAIDVDIMLWAEDETHDQMPSGG